MTVTLMLDKCNTNRFISFFKNCFARIRDFYFGIFPNHEPRNVELSLFCDIQSSENIDNHRYFRQDEQHTLIKISFINFCQAHDTLIFVAFNLHWENISLIQWLKSIFFYSTTAKRKQDFFFSLSVASFAKPYWVFILFCIVFFALNPRPVLKVWSSKGIPKVGQIRCNL